MSSAFRWFLIFVCLAGCLWRVDALVRGVPKVISSDEAVTALESRGWGQDELFEFLSSRARVGSASTIGELRSFVSGSRSVADVVRVLVVQDPQHPPLHYLLEHFWLGSGGSARGLTVLFGFMQIPLFMFLFFAPGEWLSVWMAGAVAASSPVLWNFSVEARDQSLFLLTALIALCCFARRSWTAFCFALLVSLYSSLFAVGLTVCFVAASFARDFDSRSRRGFFTAAGAAVVGFLPWIYVMVAGHSHATAGLDWLRRDYVGSVFGYVRMLIAYAVRTFFDLNLQGDSSTRGDYLVQALPSLFALFVVVASVVWASRLFRARWMAAFALCAVVLNLVSLVGPDLFDGGSRVATGRFWLLFFLGVIIAFVAWMRDAGRGRVLVLCSVCVCGIVSIGVSARASRWWTSGDRDRDASFEVIRSSRDPLIVASTMLTLAGGLDALPLSTRVTVDGGPLDYSRPVFVLFEYQGKPSVANAEVGECPTKILCRLGPRP